MRLGLSNPIVEREAFTRARSWTTPVTMVLSQCLLGAFALALFSHAVSEGPGGLGRAEDVAGAAFRTAGLPLVLALLFVPAVAAGGIAGERERGTLDVLVLSRLHPFHLTWGKLVAAVAYPVALVFVSLPVLMAVFLYAGLDLGQLVATEAVTVVSAVAIGAVATLASALSPTTVLATVRAYAATLALYGGSALVSAIAASDKRSRVGGAHSLLVANPLYAVRAVMTDIAPSGASPVQWLQPWHGSVVVQILLTAACVAASTRRMSVEGSRSGGGQHGAGAPPKAAVTAP